MNNLHDSIQALLGHYNELLRQVKELRIRVNGAGGSTDDANDLATSLVSQHTQAVSAALVGESEPAKDGFVPPVPPVPVNPMPEPVAEPVSETQEPSVTETPAV